MPLRQPPRHIQKMLDRRFHGVKLQWNPRIGFWALTDDLYCNGQKTLRPAYKPPGGMVGIEKYPLSRRGLIWVLGEPRTGERWEPSRDRMRNVLGRAFNGGRVWAKERFFDEFEAKEDALEAKAKAAGHGEKRDRAAEWFDREVKGKSSFSSLCAATARKSAEALARARARREAEQEDSDAVASQMIAAGQAAHGGVIGRL